MNSKKVLNKIFQLLSLDEVEFTDARTAEGMILQSPTFDLNEPVEEVHEDGWCEQDRFVPMISVKLPYIKLYNYNATLKIDDRTWGATNPGVWCHSLHDLRNRTVFTDWSGFGCGYPG